MCRFRVTQHLTDLNLYSVLINKILVMEFIIIKSFIKSKFNVKYVNTVRATT